MPDWIKWVILFMGVVIVSFLMGATMAADIWVKAMDNTRLEAFREAKKECEKELPRTKSCTLRWHYVSIE